MISDQGRNTNLSVPVGLDNLANLMEQQIELLRRIDQRQAAAGDLFLPVSSLAIH
jgi:hypothetical protein